MYQINKAKIPIKNWQQLEVYLLVNEVNWGGFQIQFSGRVQGGLVVGLDF